MKLNAAQVGINVCILSIVVRSFPKRCARFFELTTTGMNNAQIEPAVGMPRINLQPTL